MRVLLVEDDAATAASIELMLKKESFIIDTTDLGEDGLEIGKLYDYDIIILDLMLPDIDGYEVLRRLRAARVRTPILILSGLGELDHKIKGLGFGADDFLTKPFSFVVLVAHLRALIRRGSHPRPVVLHTGDLELDPSTRRCRRGDVDIELTPRQFSLLEFLMRRAGDAVSKTEIAENVWDEAFDGDLNIVEVYVGNLRRRVDTPFDRHSIETVRGAGYRLDPDGG